MSRLNIVEFSHLAKDATGASIPIPLATTGGTFSQSIQITNSSLQSAQFAPSTTFIRLVSDVNCYVSLGLNPTANTSSYRLIASRPELVGVQEGRALKLAVTSGNTPKEEEPKPTPKGTI